MAPVVKPDRYTTIAATASLSKPRIKEIEDSSNSEPDKRKDGLSL
jgi:hypothetical protein